MQTNIQETRMTKMLKMQIILFADIEYYLVLY